jgi:hypothetical protein
VFHNRCDKKVRNELADLRGIADMEMKTSVVKPTPWGADNGINRVALAVLVAAGALSVMGVGLAIFLIVSDGATLDGAAFWLGIVSAWAGLILIVGYAVCLI